MPEDVYYKKTVVFNAWKRTFNFRVSQELFSSHDIDVGTRLLLRTIVESDIRPHSILDLGCGYGPIGLTLKSLYPDSIVHMVDKDALAVEYSRQNADLNGLVGISIYPSLGYDDINKMDFDLITSNIPGKAGEPVIAYMLRESAYYLTPGGLVTIVVVRPLEETVAKILNNTPGVEVVLRKTGSDHVVFHYRFTSKSGDQKPPQSALERGVYTRNRLSFKANSLEYSMQTVHGLPEFDSLNYRSEITLKSLKTIQMPAANHAGVLNSGQGHVAVLLAKLLQPEKMTLIDRDFLALRVSKLNLTLNGYPAEQIEISHKVGMGSLGQEGMITGEKGLPFGESPSPGGTQNPDPSRLDSILHRSGKEEQNDEDPDKFDILVLLLREEEGNEANLLALRQAAKVLSSRGILLIAAGSTAVTRLSARLRSFGLRIRTRERWKGISFLVLTR